MIMNEKLFRCQRAARFLPPIAILSIFRRQCVSSVFPLKKIQIQIENDHQRSLCMQPACVRVS